MIHAVERVAIRTALTLALVVGAQGGGAEAWAQDTARAPEIVRSIGQPPIWRTYATAGAVADRSGDTRLLGSVSLGLERSVGNPLSGFLTATADGYVRGGNGAEVGGRLLLQSPLLFVHGGLDRNQTLGRTDFVAGATFPLRRGGWPLTGSQVRVHWVPARNHSVEVSVLLPLAQPLAGRTRPRTVHVELPGASLYSVNAAMLASEEARLTWRDTRASMTQLVSMLTFFWLIEERNVSHASSVMEWRDILADFGAEFFPAAVTRPGESQYQREAAAYHTGLERLFSLAATGSATDERGIGAMIADSARRLALREIVLPYNRTYGRYRKPNSLRGLNLAAERRFQAWLDSATSLPVEAVDQALLTFQLWTAELERMRARISEIARDPRLNWMPLGLVLRPEEHRTQSQIDQLIALAMEREFDGGNVMFTIDAPQFQHELKRTIHAARRSHVLWVHDYRGVDEAGDPDRTSIDITMTYLRALRDAVVSYDSTGRVPAYFILVDQHFWEVTGGRLWMHLLERPLTHRVKLKRSFADTQRAIGALQDSLRAAVAASSQLQDGRRRNGERWVHALIKVHVNITNPADFTFRTRRIALPLGSDNLLRDHRKMILVDPDESDPDAGEVIFAGVGIGDHYASATWEDRAMVVRGPTVAATLRYLRATLERHGLDGARMPAVFRAAAAKGEIAARGSSSATAAVDPRGARVMQTHNEVGWGPKESSFVQMLLYDLAPEGSVVFVPDALWSSYQWMAQLVGAALRGCRVYIVAPGKAHAPAAGFPWMSVQQELVTRAVLVEEVLGNVIRAGGGDLRIGLYARTTPLDDFGSSLNAVVRSWREHAFLRDAIPLPDDALAAIADAAERYAEVPPALSFPPDARGRPPLLHRKTQWVLDGRFVRALASSPQLPRALEPGVPVNRFGGVAGNTDSTRIAAAMEMVRLHALLDPAAEAPLYFTTGSINKNPRSMMVDGEVLGLVAGAWSLESFLDMLILIGTTTWVRSLEDAERLLPPYSRQQRRLGRWLYPII